jgi:hypothetical protein
MLENPCAFVDETKQGEALRNSIKLGELLIELLKLTRELLTPGCDLAQTILDTDEQAFLLRNVPDATCLGRVTWLRSSSKDHVDCVNR